MGKRFVLRAAAAAFLLACGGRTVIATSAEDAGDSGAVEESGALSVGDAARTGTGESDGSSHREDGGPTDGGSLEAGNEAGPETGVPGSDSGADGGSDAADEDVDAGAIDVSTACLVSDNKFVLVGYPWTSVVIEGGADWQLVVDDVMDDLPSFVEVDIGSGPNWVAKFSTSSLGVPLAPGLYTGAERADFTDPNVPGLDVYGDFMGCNTLTGQFQVIEITATPADPDGGAPLPTVQSFTATFVEYCEGAGPAAVGCVHFAR
jgi:hypothetical protein